MAEQSNKNKWKRYEDLAALIQRELSPDARVTQNEKIRGKTGARREIDICIRQRVGPYDILVVIDCKDHKAPVDVNHVDSFIGLVKDVRANKGAMIAANGFSSTAKTQAANAGIAIHRVVDVGDHDWRSYVGIPVLIHLRSLEQDLAIQGPPGFQPPDELSPTIYSGAGKALGSLYELAQTFAGKHSVRRGRKAGEYRDLPIWSKPTFIRRLTGTMERVSLTTSLNFGPVESYLGILDARQFRGLTDEQTGRLAAHGQRISMRAPDPQAIRETWERVADPEALAARPALEMDMFG